MLFEYGDNDDVVVDDDLTIPELVKIANNIYF